MQEVLSGIGWFFRILKWLVVLFVIIWVVTFPYIVWGALADTMAPAIGKGPAGILAGVALGVVALGLVVAVVAWRRRGRRTSGAHGTARWGDGGPLCGQPDGLPLGWAGSNLLALEGEGHIVTIAPTGSGKTVGCAVPALLSYTGSMLITDIKGELWHVTQRTRHDMGHRVHVLDPFALTTAPPASINPLDLVNLHGADFFDDSSLLAELLVDVEDGAQGGDADYWNEEAKALLAGLILYVCAARSGERRSLPEVRQVLTLPRDNFTALLDEMAGMTDAGGLIARAAARMSQKSDKDFSGVISTAQRFTHWLDSPRMERVTSTSSFSLRDLKRASVSAYLCIPDDRLRTYRSWLRIVVGATLLAITRDPAPPAHGRVRLLLDEFGNLGSVPALAQAFTLVRGKGADLWAILQDLPQLRATYPKQWESILANAYVLQAFAASDHGTAKYLSDLTGEATVWAKSAGQQSGSQRGASNPLGGWSSGRNTGQSEQKRNLLTPDEVRRMDRGEELLFVRSEAPVRARRVNYLEDAIFRGKFDDNPLHHAA